MRIYLAGPIFFLADKFRNDYFYNKLMNVDISQWDHNKKFDTQLKNIAEYQVIKDNSANCTLDELEMQCYALIGKQNFSFSKEAPSVIKIPVDKSHSDSGEAYGGLLRNKSQI